MVVVHQRQIALGMAGPSARIVTIKRETVLARPVPAPQRSRWQCSICGKLLSSKRSYDEHLNIHNQARPFTCDHCDYAAASQMTLRRHILRNHTSRDDWHYKCPYCGETYMEPASYQQHVSSRHFGRSATFGCPYPSCTFQTKCSKHFREHLVKHHSCPSMRLIKKEGDKTDSSTRVLPVNPSTIADENLQEYLVDDDLGAGFGNTTCSIARPIIRSNGEIDSVIAAAADKCAKIGIIQRELDSTHAPIHIPSVANSIPSVIPPQRRMIVMRKNDKSDDEMLALPSTSSYTVSSLPPPPALPREDLYPIPLVDDDFMKSPIALRRSMVPPSSRTLPRRVQLAPIDRSRLPPSIPIGHRRGMRGVVKDEEVRAPSPVTLGGSRHAPAIISADAAVWMIEHEEEVDEEAKHVHVYDNGCIDFECD